MNDDNYHLNRNRPGQPKYLIKILKLKNHISVPIDILDVLTLSYITYLLSDTKYLYFETEKKHLEVAVMNEQTIIIA